jgi:uncharacterized protein (DUF1800 family)
MGQRGLHVIGRIDASRTAFMTFDPIIAATRFGTGLSPVIEPPWDAESMLGKLGGPDQAAALMPIAGFEATTPTLAFIGALNKADREARGTDGEAAAKEAIRQKNRELSDVSRHNTLSTLARCVTAQDGLRERLTLFWADHFTVIGRGFNQRHLVTPYIADAIRPHVAGRFADMVKAVVMHPMMLLYLEQTRSLGPSSPQGLKSGRGLNENLARELLELHLIGVGGGYDQTDVTQMAELLTGLSYNAVHGVTYRAQQAEPGAEVVMGRRYSADSALATITSALEDIAIRPETAAHISRKLAVHFVSDTPDPDLSASMSRAFVDSGGDLLAVTGAMLQHPAAWSPVRAKVRQPFTFIAAGLRALGVRADRIMPLGNGQFKRHVTDPLRLMGQPFEQPVGPDGWAEEPAAWITPQGLAGRISWAVASPAEFVDTLPDPRKFVQTAVGPTAPPELIFAADAAESLADGVALVLTSPAFQRI